MQAVQINLCCSEIKLITFFAPFASFAANSCYTKAYRLEMVAIVKFEYDNYSSRNSKLLSFSYLFLLNRIDHRDPPH